MIRKDGLLKLMDFGIAQVLDLERMTVTGQLLGSPAYMAPELIEGKPLDVRTDVFSVGILLYQMATGELPFSGKNPHEVLRRIAEGQVRRPARPRCAASARGLARIITRALAHQPDDRYPDVAPLVGDLLADLADAGLGRRRAPSWRRTSPTRPAYEKALPARMTPALIATAETAAARARVARAMECWNRVLAYDPENAEVTAALRALSGAARASARMRHRRWRRWRRDGRSRLEAGAPAARAPSPATEASRRRSGSSAPAAAGRHQPTP